MIDGVSQEAKNDEGHSFCGNPDCTECHNEAAYEEQLVPYLEDGTMSPAEALRIYFGQVA